MAEVGKKPGVEYSYAGEKDSFTKSFARALPAGAKPTSKTGYFLSGIFLLVVILGMFNSNIFSLIGGSPNASIKIGIPLTFLDFELSDTTGDSVVKVGNMIIDLLIYIFLAYILDILVNMIFHAKFLKSKEDIAKVPQVYEDRQKPKSVAEKVTKKVFEGEEKKV